MLPLILLGSKLELISDPVGEESALAWEKAVNTKATLVTKLLLGAGNINSHETGAQTPGH